MATAQNSIKINNATVTYLDSTGQNYAEYTTDKGTAKIWLEDSTSIQNRLNLINEYGLAGSACWQYSQGTSDIWNLFR